MKQLFHIGILHMFGRAGQNARYAYGRLIAGVLFSIGAGSFLGVAIGKSVDAPPPAVNRLTFTFIFLAQLVAIGILLPIVLGRLQDVLLRLCQILPVRPHHIWLLRAQPGIIILSLCTLFLAWPLAAIGQALTLQPSATLTSILVGMLSGWGILHTLLLLPRFWTASAGVLIIAIEYFIIRTINSVSPDSPDTAMYFFALIILSSLGLVWYSFNKPFHASYSTQATRAVHHLSARQWWLIKLWRNSRTRLGFFSTLAISCGIAILAIHTSSAEVAILAPAIGILGAACTSDIRGLARLQKPPEITALRGVIYFTEQALRCGSIFCSAALLPLLIVGIGAAPTAMNTIIICSYLVFGLAIGMWVSFVFTPGTHDPLGQTMAVITAAVIILGLPHMPFINSLSLLTQSITFVLIAGVGSIAAMRIEYKRNTFIWRKL